jgi:hypothetical protein
MTRPGVTVEIEGLFRAAMRADPASMGAGLDLLVGRVDPHSLDFLYRSRLTVLAGAAALTGVAEAHRPTVGGVCLSCGTPGECRTVREIRRAFAAYRVDRPAAIDRAEAWRRGDAWLTATGPAGRTLHVGETPGGWVLRPVPATGFVLLVDGVSGRLTRHG